MNPEVLSTDVAGGILAGKFTKHVFPPKSTKAYAHPAGLVLNFFLLPTNR